MYFSTKTFTKLDPTRYSPIAISRVAPKSLFSFSNSNSIKFFKTPLNA